MRLPDSTLLALNWTASQMLWHNHLRGFGGTQRSSTFRPKPTCRRAAAWFRDVHFRTDSPRYPPSRAPVTPLVVFCHMCGKGQKRRVTITSSQVWRRRKVMIDKLPDFPWNQKQQNKIKTRWTEGFAAYSQNHAEEVYCFNMKPTSSPPQIVPL